ncbi:MAG: filamentous hemagglutinin N-terminal domain-containing protein [Ideonella sp.]
MPRAERTLHRPRLHQICLAAALCCLTGGQALAQIATDGSLGMAAQSLAGPAYSIPQSLGRLSGANLFHSFQTFNIGSGESATFTTATSGIANVISRVTGGSLSQINGQLRLTAVDGTPGFFFINPAGVTFGAGAAVDVPGAFHVGTADYVAFPDGRFHADLKQTSSFSSAAPQAFGFLGSSRVAIELRDGAAVASTRGQSIGLTAGDILIDNATVATAGGKIRLIAVGVQAGDVSFDGAPAPVAGNLTLLGDAAILSASRGDIDGGSIVLNAGRIGISAGASVHSLVQDGNKGQGGAIDVQARDALLMTDGGSLRSDTEGAGNGGAIRVRAGEILLDSQAYLYATSSPSSSGRSAAIDVVADRGLQLDGGASISTATTGSGEGGGLRLQAASMRVDHQAYVQVDAASGAAPGALLLDVSGELAMADRGRIVTGASSSAVAGTVDLRLGKLTMDSLSFIGSLALPDSSGRSGLVDIKLVGDASLSGGASLLSSSASTGDAAPVRLSAVNLKLDNASINSNAVELAGGASGNVALMLSGDLTMVNDAAIDTSTLSRGSAGTISVHARDIVLDGGSRISSSALDGTGAAGSIELTAAGRTQLRGGSSLSTSTSTSGNGGAIAVNADSVLLETGARVSSIAGLGSTGNGGRIVITATGELTLRNDASIGANTAGPGNAGDVRLVASSILLDGQAFVSNSTTAQSSGSAGRIEVVTPGDLSLRNSAFISSDTQGQGNAGLVDIRARNVSMGSAARISSGAGLGSAGDAGVIDLNLSGDLQLLNPDGLADRSPQVSTSTMSSGQGGEILIRAANVLIDAEGGGVVSFAQTGSTGRAGSITVQASGDLIIRNGGLSSSTDGAGAAGRIQIDAARVEISGSKSGLIARAGAASAGQSGSVVVEATDSIALSDNAFITIDNDATVADPSTRQPSLLRLGAPVIALRNLAFVSAESTGNVAASDVEIAASRSLLLDRSSVSTSANAGNGGSIRILTGGLATLRNGVIRTSVFGPQGNGGDIDLGAGILLLDSGFIQANTAAADAVGGRVRISAGALLTSGSSLFLGGNVPFVPRADIFGFNVIQAAAPTGVSGDVQLANPALDITGSLRELRAQAVDAGGLGRSLCQNTGGSALALAGRGGLAPSADGLLRADPEPGPTGLQSSAQQHPGASISVASAQRSAGGCR